MIKNHYWESRQALTPQLALQYLQEGNERFISNLRINRNLLQLVDETADKQFPFATILSCSDSRLSTELIFDQGLGDIFSIRLAGNIATNSAIGSMEYACKFLGSKLIVVMGHTNCGAIKGACDGIKLDNLDTILDHIRPAIAAESETTHDRTSHNKKFVDNVTWLSVQHNITIILHSSPIICDLLLAGEIGLVGAMYDVETGRAEFVQNNNNTKKITYERHAHRQKV